MFSIRGIGVILAVGFLFLLAETLSQAATIGAGQTRTVTGAIAAVDVAHRTVVLEVRAPRGDLTVGVTLAPGVEPQMRGAPLPLSQVQIGEQTELRYTREDGRLIGLRLDVRR